MTAPTAPVTMTVDGAVSAGDGDSDGGADSDDK